MAATATASAVPHLTCRGAAKHGVGGRLRRGHCGVVRASVAADTQPTKKSGSMSFIPSEPQQWGDDSNRCTFVRPEGVARVTAPLGGVRVQGVGCRV
jgi:hypothetical protein